MWNVEIDGRVTTFESPAAILVPAGARHQFVTRRASKGSFCFGIFLPRKPPAVPRSVASAAPAAPASFNAATVDSPGDVRLHLSETPDASRPRCVPR